MYCFSYDDVSLAVLSIMWDKSIILMKRKKNCHVLHLVDVMAGRYIWYQSGFNPMTWDHYAFHCIKHLINNLSLTKIENCPCR
jgi:hypothetical protein